jgi:hypothetical protein
MLCNKELQKQGKLSLRFLLAPKNPREGKFGPFMPFLAWNED